MPKYQTVPDLILKAVEYASSVVQESTDDDGEYLAMTLVHSVPAATVPEESIIILPLAVPSEGALLNFTYLAASKHVFIRIHVRPQPRLTYGQCMAYSYGTSEQLIPIGAFIKFPSAANYLVAKPEMVELMKDSIQPNVRRSLSDTTPAKRVCIRPLDTGGEQAEDPGDKPKGTFTYLLDLEGVKRTTRNKNDIPQREKDLHFVFRAMDSGKWDYSISTDLVLQPEAYRSMVCEQADTQTEDQHPAFTACGLMSRVQTLLIFSNKEKLKLLLIGSVLIEGSGEPTLTLDDFVTKETISNGAAPCPSHNAGIVSALKNIAIAMHILFSDSFEKSLNIFIDHLEGEKRIMEVVPADFLRHSVELALRKFFRVVRSVKATAIVEMKVATPDQCATYLTWLFDRLAEDLSNHPLMVKQEAYYRCKLARRSITSTAKKQNVQAEKALKPAIKFAEDTKEPTKKPSKTCAGHLGSQLGAVNKDGRPYACTYGASCTFRHVSIAGKTDQRLTDLLSSMPPVAQADIKKAISSRK